MTIGDLKAYAPNLYPVFRKLNDRLRPLSRELYGRQDLMDEEFVVDEWAIILLFLAKLGLDCEEAITKPQKYKAAWELVAETEEDAQAVQVYLSDSGDMAQVPVDFVKVIQSGKRLNASLESDPLEPSQLVIVHAGRPHGRVPASLLRHLLAERKRNLKT